MTDSAQTGEDHQALQQFLQIVSHDLNEPLRHVISFSEILQDEEFERLSQDGQFYLSSIVNAGTRLQQMLAGVLQLARLTSRAQAFTACDMDEALADTLQQLAVDIEQSGAQINHTRLPTIQADPAQMRILLRELLGNAINFARAGIAPVINIEASAGSSGLQLVVQDNGIGFEPQYADVIFAMFQQLNPYGAYPGVGKGLTLCRHICERHGGHIRAQATPQAGARVTLDLPGEIAVN